jgi:hypothetical protein
LLEKISFRGSKDLLEPRMNILDYGIIMRESSNEIKLKNKTDITNKYDSLKISNLISVKKEKNIPN